MQKYLNLQFGDQHEEVQDSSYNLNIENETDRMKFSLKIANVGQSSLSRLPCTQTKKKIATIQGSSTAQTFAGVVKRAWIHVGRVQLDTEPQTIKSYLENKFPENSFIVELLPKRLFDKAFPQESRNFNSKKRNTNKPWVTKDIIEKGKLLREIHKITKHDNNVVQFYNELKEKYGVNIDRAKKPTIIILFSTRTVWQTINSNTVKTVRKEIPDVVQSPDVISEFEFV
ncbi:hypothetical protein HHI36_010244 [Cryptolaemus montrouzieri]|uniref:Uncharacterized protein n=1 Tax=Cryptolaemus montrouzieri TaxID=559131 RepID=A0ABD2MIB3_9CUCU